MKRLLVLLLISGIVYGGYLYSRQTKLLSTRTPAPSETQSKVTIASVSNNLGSIAAILGARTENLLASGQALLSTATDGQSDPIINTAVANLQSQVKDLPKQTVDKVKYEFCKGVVTNYETKKDTP